MAEQQQQQQAAQQPGALNLPTLLQTLSQQLISLSTVVQAQSLCSIVPRFDGTPTKFKAWIKAINKYGMNTGCDDDHLKMLALQTADGPLSDYIHRWISAHQDQTWLQLRVELQSRFAEVIDKSNALGLLRRIRQERNENVQIYAERLLNLAEDAFQGEGQNPAELAPIERQLVGFFTDGLYYDYLKIKVMRENPEELRRAVALAMAEQNLRKRFNLRTGRQLDDREYREIEPMDVSAARPQYCRVCRRQGHTAANCRARRPGASPGQNVAVIQRARAQRGRNWTPPAIRCWLCNRVGHFKANCILQQPFVRQPNASQAPVASAASN